MRKITLNVDDNTKIISVTTLTQFGIYNNINVAAFDIEKVDEVTMPECLQLEGERAI